MGIKISENLIGATNRTKMPSVSGSEWSCNMFHEMNGKQNYMASVPGLKFIKNVANAATVKGSFVSSCAKKNSGYSDECFVAVGSNIVRIMQDDTCEVIGQVSDAAVRVSFAETGGERPMLLIVDGINMYAYDIKNGGAFKSVTLPNRISDNNVKIKPTHIAVVSGSIVVNDSGSGYVYYSVPYPLAQDTREVFKIENGKVKYKDDEITVDTDTKDSFVVCFLDNYQTQQYFNAESSSDAIVGVMAVGSALYIFGPKTVEIWQRGSGEYETWVRTSYTINAANGLEAPYSVAHASSKLFYVGSGDSFGKGVMMVDGTSFKKISEDWLDEKLLEKSTANAFGFCYSVGEHNFYVLQLPTIGETWVYDAMDGGWHQRKSRNESTGKEVQWRVSALSWFNEKFYAFCNDGNMYQHGNYWYEDYGSNSRLPMVRHRQTSVIVDDYKPFLFHELAVECNVGTWNEYKVQPKLILEVSSDGGNTFGNMIFGDMGLSGQYSHRVRYMGLGLNRLCVIRLTYSHPTELVLTSCSIRANGTGAMI